MTSGALRQHPPAGPSCKMAGWCWHVPDQSASTHVVVIVTWSSPSAGSIMRISLETTNAPKALSLPIPRF